MPKQWDEPIQQIMNATKTCLNCGVSLRHQRVKKLKAYCCKECYQAKPPKMVWLEREFGKPIKTLVLDELNRSPSLRKAADFLGLSDTMLTLYCTKLGIKKVVRYE